MVGGVLTSPLEVVKTRLQGTYNKEGLANTQHRFGTRTVRALTHLHAEGGVRALYRGMVPHLVGVVPARALYFGTFSWSKRELGKQLELDPHGMLLNWLGGVAAGVVTITLTSPVWVVKTRLQLQVGNGKGSVAPGTGVRQYRSAWHCVTSMMRHEGPRAFFAGMSASYVGISESSIQFMLYEKFKSLIKQRRVRQCEEAWQLELQRRRRAHTAAAPFDHDADPELVQLRELARSAAASSIGAWETLGISSTAKLVASVLTYPHEVARTRLREERAKELYGGFVNCVRVVWRNEGLAGLYGGLAPHLLRVVPNAAIMFLTYEAVLSLFDPSSSATR